MYFRASVMESAGATGLVAGLGFGSDGLGAGFEFAVGFGAGSFAAGCAVEEEESLSAGEVASGFSGAELSFGFKEAAPGSVDVAGAESVETGGVVAAGFEFEGVVSGAGELATGAGWMEGGCGSGVDAGGVVCAEESGVGVFCATAASGFFAVGFRNAKPWVRKRRYPNPTARARAIRRRRIFPGPQCRGGSSSERR